MDILRKTGAWFLDLVRKQGGGFVAGVGLALVFAIVMSASWPHISAIFDLGFWSEGGKDVSRLDVVRNLSLVGGGLLGIGLALWRSKTAQDVARSANRQAYLVEQGQITDRFSSAIKMLSSENPVERIGGIHTLGRVAESDIETYHIPVMQILLKFIEDYRPGFSESEGESSNNIENASGESRITRYQYKDINEAFSVISNRNFRQLAFEEFKDFGCVVYGAKFTNVNFDNIYINEIEINNCSFSYCDFEYSYFNNCIIKDSVFANIDFNQSVFNNTSINDFMFNYCSFVESEFNSVNLFTSHFFKCNFVQAEFFNCTIHQCEFSDTDFDEADVITTSVAGVEFENCAHSERIGTSKSGSECND